LAAQKKTIRPKGAEPNAGWSHGILIDGALFDRMNTVYKATFPDPKPTRTTVVVAKLVGAGHVEITATARK
jgi:enamine deaminase RidA (YjgF/YER057c/UK114 family)